MKLTHIDHSGQASMVDISDKVITVREAQAEAVITMKANTLQLIQENQLKKGDVLATSRLAGILAAKKTADLIPLCHPLALSKVSVDFEFLLDQSAIRILSYCKLAGRTGVEMEALTAASVAALTVYDMAKAIDKGMEVKNLRLLSKSGGKSGDYTRQGDGEEIDD